MCDGVEIKEGPYGRGVFATRAFEKGEAVESCPTLELPEDTVTGRLGDYVFGSAEGGHEVILLLGYGMLYNHSYEANCEYVQDGPRVITFVTTRDVEAGEEVTIDYGEGGWSPGNLEPDPCPIWPPRPASSCSTTSRSRSTSSAPRSRCWPPPTSCSTRTAPIGSRPSSSEASRSPTAGRSARTRRSPRATRWPAARSRSPTPVCPRR